MASSSSSSSSCKEIIVYVLVLTIIGGGQTNSEGDEVSFDENYYILYGDKLVSLLDQGRQVQLSMDQSSGSGFVSKRSYGSGFFHLRVKLPPKDSSGVVTTFYLNSTATNSHEEVDFEFLGNSGPITLQTNVFANGKGNREQRIHLWFDPTADFHDYQVHWNQHLLVFYVDRTPIRVFKNQTDIGLSYPSSPMEIKATIWEAEWATTGRKINWTRSPFQANYRGFNISGCQYQNSNPQECHSPNFWWNTDKYSELSPDLHRAYQNVRDKYMYYDYCSDKERFPEQPLECASNL